MSLVPFLPAFIAGLLVISTHVPLGREVLRSGIVFLDLAVAQAAGLGVILAATMVPGRPLAVQAAAATAALGAALLLTWSERHAGRLQEALIGSLFVIAASLSLIVLSASPEGADRLQDLLIGQILWVGWGDLLPVAALSAAVLAAWFRFGARLGRMGFYLLFALTVTASVQLVGVYLVFATLILPALAVSGGVGGLPLGYAGALSGYALGFLAALLFDLPAGPTIVCALAVASAALAAARIRPTGPE